MGGASDCGVRGRNEKAGRAGSCMGKDVGRVGVVRRVGVARVKV